jgi:hypothetical protein
VGPVRRHNQAIKRTVCNGAFASQILRPVANHFASKLAPFCRLLRRYAASFSKDSGNLKVAGVPREFFEVRGVSVPVETNLLLLRQWAREVSE